MSNLDPILLELSSEEVNKSSALLHFNEDESENILDDDTPDQVEISSSSKLLI